MTEGNNNDNNDQKQDEQMDISNANNGTDQPPEPAAQDLSSPVDDIAQSMKAVQELVKQLHEKLETLHNDAIEKEKRLRYRVQSESFSQWYKKRKRAAARKARHDIARVENQLKALLTMADYTDVLPAEKDLPSEKSTEPKGNPDPPPVKRGLCKFLCGSYTHQFATDCDVYTTIRKRENRMNELHICFRCFQQHFPSTSSKADDCKQVPCYYCTQAGREMRGHVSALCPFMFPYTD